MRPADLRAAGRRGRAGPLALQRPSARRLRPLGRHRRTGRRLRGVRPTHTDWRPTRMTGSDLLCLDVGSTFTKAVLVGADGEVRGTAETPTTRATDVLHGCHALAEELGAGSDTTTLACSSAGGGLRLAVVGYERQVTAEAGYRVGLSAGAKVVHVASGRLDASEVKAVGRSLPDLVLLVGGTDGGNSEVLLHNAAQLARAALGRPVVVAGNVDARDEVVALLRGAGQPVRRRRRGPGRLPPSGPGLRWCEGTFSCVLQTCRGRDVVRGGERRGAYEFSHAGTRAAAGRCR